MPRSSRHHKSHKQSKHSSKDYPDSEEDVKMKEKTSKDENLVRVKLDSASGEKRKISSQVREGEDLSGYGNGEVSEKYVSSKRRKDKTDIGSDRWNGDGELREDSKRKVEKEISKGESSKIDSKAKDSLSKSESLRSDSKNKHKRHVSGSTGEKKEEHLTSMVGEKEESKSKVESKRKSERDSSARKESKDIKENRRSEKDKSGGQESRNGGDEVKLDNMAAGKKQGSQLEDLSDERHGKHARENTERTVHQDLPITELERESEKKLHRRKEGSTERERHCSDSKEGGERRLPSRGACTKDLKYKDDGHKDARNADKYPDEGCRGDGQRNDKYREEADKDIKHWDDKCREDGEKSARRRGGRHREDVNRDDSHKDEKHKEDGEKDSRRKDDKNRGGTEKNGRCREDKYHEDGDKDIKFKDDQYREDGDKDYRRLDEKYNEDNDRDGRQRENYLEDGERDNRHKDKKYREDIEQDTRHKDRKPGDDFHREKRLSDAKYRDAHISRDLSTDKSDPKRSRDDKYRDDHISRDLSTDKSDPKRSRDDAYASEHHSRKLSAYDDSPTRDDRTPRSRDDQLRRRTNEKEDYIDLRSRSTKNQRSESERKSGARMDPATDRGRSTRNADMEHPPSQTRRRSSPTLSSRSARDHYRPLKQDESKFRDYNYKERVRHNISSTRDYGAVIGGSDKISSSRSLDKLGQKVDGQGEFSSEMRQKSDIRSSPLQLVDRSPSITERRQFSRFDVRRSTDLDESTQKSGGSRDIKDYSNKESKGNRELAMDALPGDDFSQAADADNHFNSNSRPLPPPLFRTGVDSPSFYGSAEADSRGKASNRNRRNGDPNMGRFQGNAWRGVPSWPMGNGGFMPFPHAPSVGFHSVMQPFPAPTMFGIRPSMELNHPSYHVPDADRFSGPGRPMGWHNQVDDSRPPFKAWDASNAGFGDDSHMYGWPDWDQSRNVPGGHGWETSGDLWKAPNRTACLDSEKENKSTPSADVGLDGQFIQPAQSDQPHLDQQADSTDISELAKSIEKNDSEAPFVSLEETAGVEMSKDDDVCLSHFYLSKLDISADLAEPELYDQCTGSLDQSMFSNVDDSTILYMEEAVGAKLTSHKILMCTLVASADDSVFQKAMSLYERQKCSFGVEDEEQLGVLSEITPKSNQKDVEDIKTEDLCPVDNIEVFEDVLPTIDMDVDPQNSLQKMEVHVEPKNDTTEILEAIDHVNVEVNTVLDQGLQEKLLPKEMIEVSDATTLPHDVKDMSAESGINNEEMRLLDSKVKLKLIDSTKCVPMLNSDVSTVVEAVMPESIMSGSVNISRIHHSPESTH